MHIHNILILWLPTIQFVCFFVWPNINFDFAFLITFVLHLFTLSSNCKSEYTRRYNGCRNRFKVGLPTHRVILILLPWVKWTHLHSYLHFLVDFFIIFFDCCLLGFRNIPWNCGYFYLFILEKMANDEYYLILHTEFIVLITSPLIVWCQYS